uniref:Uncharacterized protein n=1 Tax=Meloidogyne enterolobii TaxID=390850 RepID=A0A6V7TYP2_MELEN|nr:unnamed protein product [Meloidogyne enterolobii]
MKNVTLIIIGLLLIIQQIDRKSFLNAFFIPTHVHFFQFLNPQQQTQNQLGQQNLNTEERSFLVKAIPYESNQSLNDEIKESSSNKDFTFKNENKKDQPKQIKNSFDFEYKNEKLDGNEYYYTPPTLSLQKSTSFKNTKDPNTESVVIRDLCQLPNLRRSAEEENLFIECEQTKEISKELGRNDIGIWKIKKCPSKTVFVPSAQICLPDKRSRLRKIIGSKFLQSSSKEEKPLYDGQKLLTIRHRTENCSSTEELNQPFADHNQLVADCDLLDNYPLCENVENKHCYYSQRSIPNNYDRILTSCICICVEVIFKYKEGGERGGGVVYVGFLMYSK